MNVGLWIYLVIMSLVLLFAVLGNALVIYCVVRFRKLRSVTNGFICNLSVTDIILAGFVIPQRLHDITHVEDFHEGNALCKIVYFFPVFIITSSIYTLVCVSFERHRAIKESHKTQLTYSGLYKICPAILLFGFLVSMPTLVEYQVNSLPRKAGDNASQAHYACDSTHVPRGYSLTNAITVTLVSYVVPVFLIFYNYIRVSMFVWKKAKQVNAAPNSARNQNFQLFRNRIRIIKLLILVAVVFAVSWLPFFITLLYAKITNRDASSDASGFLNLFLLAMATFSTAYNIVLYVVFNPNFRQAIRQVLRIRLKPSAKDDRVATIMGTRCDFIAETQNVDITQAVSNEPKRKRVGSSFIESAHKRASDC